MDIIWEFLDHNFWQTSVTLIAVAVAFWIGKLQHKINALISRTHDAVELYSSYLIVKNQDEDSGTPYIHVQNIGTRLIYLDKYIFTRGGSVKIKSSKVDFDDKF